MNNFFSMNTLISGILMSIGSGLAFVSFTFASGKFMPNALSRVYELISYMPYRMFIGCLTIIFVANLMFVRGYDISGQATGGALHVCTLVVSMVIVAMLVDKTPINWHIMGGVLVLCAGAVWVVYGLNQSSA